MLWIFRSWIKFIKLIYLEWDKFSNEFDYIPEPESFINKDDDDFYDRFLQKSDSTLNESNEDKSVINTTQKPARASRWLKSQDRELILAFYKLSKEFTNTKTNEFWVKLRDKLKTNRPVKFLRRRYRKLVRTQTLNKHEKLFFEENHDKFSIPQFMIIYPGKTQQTIIELYKEKSRQKSLLSHVNRITEDNIKRVSFSARNWYDKHILFRTIFRLICLLTPPESAV